MRRNANIEVSEFVGKDVIEAGGSSARLDINLTRLPPIGGRPAAW